MFKRQIVLIAVGVLTSFTLLVSRPWRSSIVYRRLLVIILGPVPVHFAVVLNGVDRFPLVPRRLSVAAYRAGLVINAIFLPWLFSTTNGALTKNCNYGSFPVFEILRIISTLVFQLEDTVCLFGTLLLLDPINFPKSEPCLLIGSVCQNGALLGTSL